MQESWWERWGLLNDTCSYCLWWVVSNSILGVSFGGWWLLSLVFGVFVMIVQPIIIVSWVIVPPVRAIVGFAIRLQRVQLPRSPAVPVQGLSVTFWASIAGLVLIAVLVIIRAALHIPRSLADWIIWGLATVAMCNALATVGKVCVDARKDTNTVLLDLSACSEVGDRWLDQQKSKVTWLLNKTWDGLLWACKLMIPKAPSSPAAVPSTDR